MAVLALVALRATPALGSAPPTSASADLTSRAVDPAGASGAQVRLRDEVVFVLRVGHEAQSTGMRASDASRALADAAKLGSRQVRVVRSGEARVVYAGDSPIVQLYEDDARAAGDTSLEVHAAAVAARVRQALEAEHTRTAIADTVFAISLVIFLGLVTLYLLKKSGELTRRLRRFLDKHPERIGALKVYSYELLGPGSARLALLLLANALKWLLRGAVLYGYLLLVTTLFGPTRAFAEQLTRWLVVPVSELVARLAASLPVLLVVLVAAAVVWLLLRLSSLFFASVAEGETKTDWVGRDMAEALGGLIGIGIVVVALVFAAPVVTGQPAGAFAKVGTHLLLALALGAAPILASAGLGAVIVLRRHVRFGDRVELGNAVGTVRHFGLVDLVLIDDRGDEVRVPYLAALLSPLRICRADRVSVTLGVDPRASQLETLGVLREALEKLGTRATVRLVALEVGVARYELSAPRGEGDVRERLLLEASEALREAGIALTRSSVRGEPPP